MGFFIDYLYLQNGIHPLIAYYQSYYSTTFQRKIQVIFFVLAILSKSGKERAAGGLFFGSNTHKCNGFFKQMGISMAEMAGISIAQRRFL